MKFLLAGRKGIRDNIINEFMSYKPILQDNDKKNNNNQIKIENELEKDFYGEDEEFDDAMKNKFN